jgi:hypothetical protein
MSAEIEVYQCVSGSFRTTEEGLGFTSSAGTPVQSVGSAGGFMSKNLEINYRLFGCIITIARLKFRVFF